MKALPVSAHGMSSDKTPKSISDRKYAFSFLQPARLRLRHYQIDNFPGYHNYLFHAAPVHKALQLGIPQHSLLHFFFRKRQRQLLLKAQLTVDGYRVFKTIFYGISLVVFREAGLGNALRMSGQLPQFLGNMGGKGRKQDGKRR